MENFNIPEIQPLIYKGYAVATSKQLSELYHCQRHNIIENFKNHRNFFIEGVDYFTVQGEELQNFKAQNPHGGYKPGTQKRGRFESTALIEGGRFESTALFAFANSVNSLHLWTKSGALKHAQFINTSYAKKVFEKLSQSYFLNTTAQINGCAPPVNPSRFASSKIKKPKFKENLTFEQLQFLISNCPDDKLKLELIRRAMGKYELPKCVYILALSNGTVKIGVTQDFRRRAREIIADTGFNVVNWCHTGLIPAEIARDIETALLEKFDSAKVDGEFFNVEFETALNELALREEISDSMNLQ